MPYNVIRLGGETRVNSTSAGAQYINDFSSWTPLPGGGFVAHWIGNGTVAGQEDSSGFFQRFFDANGQPVGDEIWINTSVAGDIWDSSAQQLAGGGWLNLWSTMTRPNATSI